MRARHSRVGTDAPSLTLGAGTRRLRRAASGPATPTCAWIKRHGRKAPFGVRPMRGYSLVELLVAIIVIGLGALGAVGLQLANAKNTRIALERTTAVILAQDMAERLRANPSGGYLGVAEDTGPPGFVNCLAANCAPHELERFDVAAWKCSLGRWVEEGACRAARAAGALPSQERQPGLPMGDGRVNWGPDGEFTVVVSWQAAGVQHASVAGRR